LALLNFKLLALNIYNYVHIKKITFCYLPEASRL